MHKTIGESRGSGSAQARFLLPLAALIVIALVPAKSPATETRAIAAAGNVTAGRVQAPESTGTDWLVNGRDFGSMHFSPLKQIDDRNVRDLGLAWSLDLDSPEGLAAEPIEVDGTIYIPGTLDRVFAVNAATGRLLWTYDPHLDLGNTIFGSYAAHQNRGVAVWEGKVYIGLGSCQLAALSADSGTELWRAQVCDPKQTGVTGAPAVGDGKVYIGYFGSDTGTRGSLVAIDANTGKLAWRFWNTPGDPAKGYKSKAMAMAAKTWHGKEWWQAGGGAIWDSIVYDPASNLVIYGTAGPAEGRGYLVKTTGARLFSDCVVAVNADTGEYVWHYQTAQLAPPGTEGPENFHIVIANIRIHGAERRVVMTVPRWGAFIVLDARKGELVSWKQLSVGRTTPDSWTAAHLPRDLVIGKDWWPTSYNELTGLVYIPVYEHTQSPGEVFDYTVDGRLIAWNPITESPAWSVRQQLPINGGVLSTAGNLVFQGEGTGRFSAYSATTGSRLWSIDTGSAIDGIPITYALAGTQYILVPVGLGSGTRLFSRTSAMATPRSKRGPSRLLAFAVGARTPFLYPPDVVPAVPKPPKQTASAAQIRRGLTVLNKYECWGCHGGSKLDGAGAWVTNGAVPDLRYMPPMIHKQFYAIVLGGIRRKRGMPGFGDGLENWPFEPQMSLEDARALYAYIVSVQWKAYEQDQERLSRKRH